MSIEDTSAIWSQPELGDPSPYILFQNEMWRKRKERGIGGDFNPSTLLDYPANIVPL